MLLRKVVGQAIYLIDCELDLIRMDLEHPDRFITFPEEHPPLARWNGKITELIEYMLPLQIEGKLLLPSGKIMDYADLVRFLESAYGISIAGPYDRKSEVLSRGRPSAFIEKMLGVFKEAVKNIYR